MAFILSADGIVKYMRSKAGPSSKLLQSVAEAEKFLDNPDHAIIGKYPVLFYLSVFFSAHVAIQVTIYVYLFCTHDLCSHEKHSATMLILMARLLLPSSPKYSFDHIVCSCALNLKIVSCPIFEHNSTTV